MKKYIIRLLYISMTILLVFLLVIINPDAKTENQENYNVMQKGNYDVKKELIVAKEKEKTTIKKEPIKEIQEKQKKKKEINDKSIKKEEFKTKETKTTNVVQTSSTNKSNQNKSTDKNTKTIKYGTFGRLYISSYNAALYDFNVNTKSNIALQTIVNNKDSAAYYRNHGKLVIADHYNQGFSILTKINEGTTAQIKFKDGTIISYKLIKKSEGVNTGPDLVDNEGNSFFDMESDMIMYTCYEDGIMATLWALL